jgi:hypothetical protein
MKVVAGCWMLVTAFFVFSESAIAQTDTTSYFEIKLYNTQNKLVTGKDVDLYQGVTKKYDLTESSTVPGVYSHATVKVGEYDIYVNGSSWKPGLWIGSNKVTHVSDLFRFTSGADTMRITGHIRATSFEGDGSKLTGIVGSVSSTTGDLILGADSDDNGTGDVRLQIGGSDRLRIYNDRRVYFIDSTLVVGNANLGSTATSLPGIEAHEDTTTQISVNRIYGASTGSRHGMLLLDDFNDVVSLVSGKTGTVPDGNAAWPMRFVIGGTGEVLRMTTAGRIGIRVTDPVGGFLHLHGSTGFSDGFALTTPVTGSTASDGFHISSDVLGGVSMTNRESSYMIFGTNDQARMHIGFDGHVSISGSLPGTSLALDVVSTDGAFAPPRMTMTQRNALTPSNGMIVYVTSTGKFYYRQSAAWDSLGGPAVSSSSPWNKPTSTRIEPATLTDTVRVNQFRLVKSPSNGYEMTADANGNGSWTQKTFQKSWVLESPTSSENFGAITFPFAVTVDSVRAVLRGSATPSVTINFAHGLDRDGTGAVNLFSSGQTITSTTKGNRLATFNDATLAACEWIWLTSSAQSGTVNELNVTVYFKKD